MGLFETLVSLATVAVVAASPLPADAPKPQGVWPVESHQVVRGFEPPSETWAAGHRGVDLMSSLGAPVVASLAGTVTFAGVVAGRGVVVIGHGDTRTTYEPVIAAVHEGDSVTAGERIGALDVTQSHCFPDACLHWGWIRDEEYLDPLALVSGDRQIRLLPLS